MIADLLTARGLILDSNLLLLFVVGSLDRQLIGKHKRTRNYTEEDFDLLRRILALKTRLITTPNILTEVSNLVAQIEGTKRSTLLSLLSRFCQMLDEHYIESTIATQNRCYSRLGLTDSVLATLCVSDGFLLTDDLALYLEVERAGGRAANFNHLRTETWQQSAWSSKDRTGRGKRNRSSGSRR